MTAVERLEAAIAKLERLKADSPGRLYTSNELLVTLHRTVDAVLSILRNDIEIYTRYVEEGWVHKWVSAVERSGDLALADAILGENS